MHGRLHQCSTEASFEPSALLVPVTEDAMYFSSDVAGEAFTQTRFSHLSAFHIPLWKYMCIWMHTVRQAEKLTLMHALVTHCCYVSVDAGGLTVRHSLPPTEQA